MEPIAAGFMILVAAAAVTGVLVGAVGGAVAWRLRMNIVLGGVLTAVAYLLVLVLEHHEDFIFLRAKLIWGIPSMSVAFLICSVSAPWLAAHTSLRPTWVALAALGFSLGMGSLYLLLFGLGFRAPLVAASVMDPCLVLLLLRNTRERT